MRLLFETGMRSIALAHAYLQIRILYIAPHFSSYHMCANACLKCSKPLMSARRPFVAFFSCSESWCVRTLRMENIDRDRESCKV